jgi:hypothetical protein
MAGKSLSHHPGQPAWTKTELQQLSGDKEILETDRVTVDTGVAEMAVVTGGYILGIPRGRYLTLSHHIIQQITPSSFRMF